MIQSSPQDLEKQNKYKKANKEDLSLSFVSAMNSMMKGKKLSRSKSKVPVLDLSESKPKKLEENPKKFESPDN